MARSLVHPPDKELIVSTGWIIFWVVVGLIVMAGATLIFIEVRNTILDDRAEAARKATEAAAAAERQKRRLAELNRLLRRITKHHDVNAFSELSVGIGARHTSDSWYHFVGGRAPNPQLKRRIDAALKGFQRDSERLRLDEVVPTLVAELQEHRDQPGRLLQTLLTTAAQYKSINHDSNLHWFISLLPDLTQVRSRITKLLESWVPELTEQARQAENGSASWWTLYWLHHDVLSLGYLRQRREDIPVYDFAAAFDNHERHELWPSIDDGLWEDFVARHIPVPTHLEFSQNGIPLSWNPDDFVHFAQQALSKRHRRDAKKAQAYLMANSRETLRLYTPEITKELIARFASTGELPDLNILTAALLHVDTEGQS